MEIGADGFMVEIRAEGLMAEIRAEVGRSWLTMSVHGKFGYEALVSILRDETLDA